MNGPILAAFRQAFISAHVRGLERYALVGAALSAHEGSLSGGAFNPFCFVMEIKGLPGKHRKRPGNRLLTTCPVRDLWCKARGWRGSSGAVIPAGEPSTMSRVRQTLVGVTKEF